MPIAINGSGTVTGVSVGGLPDGIVDTDMLAANAVTAAKTTVPGITGFDQWYLSSAHSSNGDITSNFARTTSAGTAVPLGSGMSESSGIFTFPTTGKYLIITTAEFSINGSDNCILDTEVTTNNSSYTVHTRCVDGNNGSGERSGKATSYAFIDVTDTSQVKVKFATLSFDSGSYLVGSGTIARTSFLFIRLGPT